jgi:hypothetical protein
MKQRKNARKGRERESNECSYQKQKNKKAAKQKQAVTHMYVYRPP